MVAEVPKVLDPAIHRRRLFKELRNAREVAKKSQHDVATAMDWSISKLIRIETGRASIRTNDLRVLLEFYEVNKERISELIELAKKAREGTQWDVYKNAASPEYITYCSYESSAAIIRDFEPITVPGLLQTEDYARAVISTWFGGNSETVDSLVDLRMQRQELLVRPDPPQLHCIIDESVLRRMVAGPQVMLDQLRRLQDYGEHPGVTLRVMPFSAGFYQHLGVAFVLLEFSDPEDEEILYLEPPLGEMLRENSSKPDPLTPASLTPASALQFFWEKEQIAKRQEFGNAVTRAIESLP